MSTLTSKTGSSSAAPAAPGRAIGTAALQAGDRVVLLPVRRPDTHPWESENTLSTQATTEANIAVVRRFIDEVVNGGCLDVIDRLWADDEIWRGGSLGEHRGTDAYRKFMAAQCRRRLQRHAPGHRPGRRGGRHRRTALHRQRHPHR
ncbi:hypothetical protein GCM10010145_48090 [Streptomyces ruber]|uniref:SnoaL-like domain-containing protein n=2 Tax=Streptomyces TaxID=1883 RepID=A0A918BLM6_9ACTN|nr:hypothetical protein GCM10010145_48090 [Streptomyces ruber]